VQTVNWDRQLDQQLAEHQQLVEPQRQDVVVAQVRRKNKSTA
jgi:hypothetical protein